MFSLNRDLMKTLNRNKQIRKKTMFKVTIDSPKIKEKQKLLFFYFWTPCGRRRKKKKKSLRRDTSLRYYLRRYYLGLYRYFSEGGDFVKLD